MEYSIMKKINEFMEQFESIEKLEIVMDEKIKMVVYVKPFLVTEEELKFLIKDFFYGDNIDIIINTVGG